MPEERPALADSRSAPSSDPTSHANARRAHAIVASLQSGDPGSEEVFDAFWELDALPIDEVRDALAAWVGPLPDMDRLDSATRVAHGLPPRPLRLRTLSVARDADILDLGPVAEEQLRLAGKSWDGVDLAPEERLDGELEGSFAGTFERRVLADADAPGDVPLYEVLLFGADSGGIVFAAGKTTPVAFIADGKVETRERRTRVALEEALAASKLAQEPALAHDTESALSSTPARGEKEEKEELASPAETPEVEGPAEPKPLKAAKRPSTRAKPAKPKSEPAKKAVKTAKKTATKAKPAKKPSAKKTAKTSAKPAAKTAAKKRATGRTTKKG